ncbi:MAG: tetratricopeptide repeat protein [Coriobacteriales bacterium]|nr:tetratricopeptide repeat protein [Coriobacteriales bacterium]
MRIFISYGHDQNVPVVDLIRRDLEKRGHRVFIDEADIKSGDDWRYSITKALLECETTFSFASAYSVRVPGVCLEELSIAVGVKGALVQSIVLEANVRPPATVRFRNSIDMIGWQSHVGDRDGLAWYKDWAKRLHDAGRSPQRKAVFSEYWGSFFTDFLSCDGRFQEWYKPKLDQIIAVVEDARVVEYVSQMNELRAILSPDEDNVKQHTFEREVYNGRAWLKEMLDEWMGDEHAPRTLLVTGAPGVGKSAFVAHELLFNERVGAAVYCEWNNPVSNNPECVARSIAFQLASRFPDYRLRLLNLVRGERAQKDNPTSKCEGTAFERYVIKPLKNLISVSRPTMVILVDGIDELERPGITTKWDETIPGMIALHEQNLPPWIRFVVTCRRHSDAISHLRKSTRVDIEESSGENVRDVREYIALRLETDLSDRRVERVLTASSGIFLHAKLLCDEITYGWVDPDALPRVPQPLGMVYRRYFDRMFSDAVSGYVGESFKGYAEAFSVLSVCPEPVPVRILRMSAGWSDPDFTSFLIRCGHFASVAGGCVTLTHKSIADWLRSPLAGEYQVDTGLGLRALATVCFTEYENGVMRMGDFGLANLIGFVEDARASCLSRSDDRETFALMLDRLISDVILARLLLKKAKDSIAVCRYDTAESFSRDAVRVFGGRLRSGRGDSEDVGKLAEAYLSLADSLDLAVRLEEAVSCCDEGILDLRTAQEVLFVDGEPASRGIGYLAMKRAYVLYRLGYHSDDVEKGYWSAYRCLRKADEAIGAAESLVRLSAFYRQNGNNAKAAGCADAVEDCLDLAQCAKDKPELFCFIRIYQGDAYLNAERFDDAEACLRQAERTSFEPWVNLSAAMRAQLHFQLSSLYYQRGDYEDAEAQAVDALRFERLAYGETSVESCNGLNQLGWCLMGRGKPRDALKQFEESYRIRRILYGDDNPLTIISLRNCASARMELGGEHVEMAESELSRILAIRKTMYTRSDEQGRIAETLLDLSSLYLKTGRHDDAFEHAVIAESLYCALPDAMENNRRSIARCYELIGEAMNSKGETAEALEMLAKSLDLYVSAYGEHSEHRNVVRVRKRIAGLS